MRQHIRRRYKRRTLRTSVLQASCPDRLHHVITGAVVNSVLDLLAEKWPRRLQQSGERAGIGESMSSLPVISEILALPACAEPYQPASSFKGSPRPCSTHYMRTGSIGDTRAACSMVTSCKVACAYVQRLQWRAVKGAAQVFAREAVPLRRRFRIQQQQLSARAGARWRRGR